MSNEDDIFSVLGDFLDGGNGDSGSKPEKRISDKSKIPEQRNPSYHQMLEYYATVKKCVKMTVEDESELINRKESNNDSQFSDVISQNIYIFTNNLRHFLNFTKENEKKRVLKERKEKKINKEIKEVKNEVEKLEDAEEIENSDDDEEEEGEEKREKVMDLNDIDIERPKKKKKSKIKIITMKEFCNSKVFAGMLKLVVEKLSLANIKDWLLQILHISIPYMSKMNITRLKKLFLELENLKLFCRFKNCESKEVWRETMLILLSFLPCNKILEENDHKELDHIYEYLYVALQKICKRKTEFNKIPPHGHVMIDDAGKEVKGPSSYIIGSVESYESGLEDKKLKKSEEVTVIAIDKCVKKIESVFQKTLLNYYAIGNHKHNWRASGGTTEVGKIKNSSNGQVSITGIILGKQKTIQNRFLLFKIEQALGLLSKLSKVRNAAPHTHTMYEQSALKSLKIIPIIGGFVKDGECTSAVFNNGKFTVGAPTSLEDLQMMKGPENSFSKIFGSNK